MSLISIIVSSFNKGALIEQTLNSVLAQHSTQWELIVVDDHSSDQSVEVLSRFSDRNGITVVCNPVNRGANHCRNQGLQLAKGDYVMFLDADDLLATECVGNRIAKAEQHPAFELFVFPMGVFRKQIGDSTFEWQPRTADPLRDFLQHRLPWTIVQPLWKKSLLLELGGFDLEFERLQDVELHTRAVMRSGLRYRLFTGSPDCYYRIDEERKVFTTSLFMRKWVESALAYCAKFSKIVPGSYKKYLSGTLFQTWLQVLHRYKHNELPPAEFTDLQSRLLSYPLPAICRAIFLFARWYNLLPLRIPGVNRTLQILLIQLS